MTSTEIDCPDHGPVTPVVSYGPDRCRQPDVRRLERVDCPIDGIQLYPTSGWTSPTPRWDS